VEQSTQPAAPPAATRPRFGQAFYLAGDSHPADAHGEADLRAQVQTAFAGWTGQAELLALAAASPTRTGVMRTGRMDKHIPHRVAALEAALPDGPARGRTVLFGRSSGARVITELARRQPVMAVVCLGYPFARPGQPPDPARYAHLATIAVPTLIVQGNADEYGDRTAVQAYPLSPAVTLRFVHGRHGLRLSPEGWQRVGRIVLGFCRTARRAALARSALTGP